MIFKALINYFGGEIFKFFSFLFHSQATEYVSFISQLLNILWFSAIPAVALSFNSADLSAHSCCEDNQPQVSLANRISKQVS